MEGISNPFKYVGSAGVRDDGNGLLYMRARYYDPEVGRFISKDPIGFAGGDLNLYNYVGGNPVNRIDPTGLYDETYGRATGDPAQDHTGPSECQCTYGRNKEFYGEEFTLCASEVLGGRGGDIVSAACAVAIKYRVHPIATGLAILGTCGGQALRVLKCADDAYRCSGGTPYYKGKPMRDDQR